jgi:hypothetical protein
MKRLKMPKTLKVEIVTNDKLDNFYEEDIVKQLWPRLLASLTSLRGVNKGEINLEDGAVIITWSYEDTDEDKYTEDEVGWYEAYKLNPEGEINAHAN